MKQTIRAGAYEPLTALLASIYTPSEFLAMLSEHDGADTTSMLPNAATTAHTTFFRDAVRILDRNGHLTQEFFERISAQRPLRSAEINAIAQDWKSVPGPPRMLIEHIATRSNVNTFSGRATHITIVGPPQWLTQFWPWLIGVLVLPSITLVVFVLARFEWPSTVVSSALKDSRAVLSATLSAPPPRKIDDDIYVWKLLWATKSQKIALEACGHDQPAGCQHKLIDELHALESQAVDALKKGCVPRFEKEGAPSAHQLSLGSVNICPSQLLSLPPQSPIETPQSAHFPVEATLSKRSPTIFGCEHGTCVDGGECHERMSCFDLWLSCRTIYDCKD